MEIEKLPPVRIFNAPSPPTFSSAHRLLGSGAFKVEILLQLYRIVIVSNYFVHKYRIAFVIFAPKY